MLAARLVCLIPYYHGAPMQYDDTIVIFLMSNYQHLEDLLLTAAYLLH
jgi:hypothetical protein